MWKGFLSIVAGATIVLVAGELGPVEKRVGSYDDFRRPLTDQKKVELAVSKLEQLIRTGKLGSLVLEQGVDYRNASVARSSQELLIKLEEAKADSCEDPREKPIVDLTVRKVEITGRRAIAHTTVRIAHRVGGKKFLTQAREAELEFVKKGRGWCIVFNDDLLKIIDERRKVLSSSFRGMSP